MTPAERGALEEIAANLASGRDYRINDLKGLLRPDDYALLEAIHDPLRKRDGALEIAANADDTRIPIPEAVAAYRLAIDRIRYNNRAGEGRLKRNRRRIEILTEKIAEDEQREAKFQKEAWAEHAKLSSEDRRWLHDPRWYKGFPPSVQARVPLEVANGGADNADVEAIKILLRRLVPDSV